LTEAQTKLNENHALLNDTKHELEEKEKLIEQATSDLKEKRQLIEYLDQKVVSLSNAHQKLIDFEHDQLNLMITLDGGIKSGDKKVMQKCLERYGAAVQEVLELKPDSLDVSGLAGSSMLPIRHLILSKAQLALSQSVKFTVETSQPIENIGMDLKDFTRILGIWLDNALEEAIHTEEKWIHVSFILDTDLDDLSVLEVRVSNSRRPKLPIDINNLHQQGVTSKGENRGNGLRIIHELMLKHEHIHVVTTAKVNETKFTQMLGIEID
jgi:two-component system sensor histidine kinase AgrC